MKKSNENSLKEVIEQLIDTYRLRDRLNEVKIRRTWEDVMGNAISNRTDHLSVNNGTLVIKVSSAALREELTFRKDQICELMNKELGGPFLTKVVIS